jgi:hypothetical protein
MKLFNFRKSFQTKHKIFFTHSFGLGMEVTALCSGKLVFVAFSKRPKKLLKKQTKTAFNKQAKTYSPLEPPSLFKKNENKNHRNEKVTKHPKMLCHSVIIIDRNLF